VNLTVKDKEYWDFSFHEMGKYDVPANIDFVRAHTGVDKVIYLGHSQGTMQFWIANILNDDLGSKLEGMVGFAPIMYLGNQTSVFVNTLFGLKLDKIWMKLGNDKLLFLKNGYNWFDSLVCKVAPTFVNFVPRTVWTFVQTIVGIDKKSHMNPRFMPMMAKNDVGGTGMWNIEHYRQLVFSDKFLTPDRPGMPAPTEYDISKLKENLKDVKIQFFVGSKDAFSPPGDVERLVAALPEGNVAVQPIDDYNHLDYMWAKDVGDFVSPVLNDFVDNL